jgi:hypothetical protein
VNGFHTELRVTVTRLEISFCPRKKRGKAKKTILCM